MKKEVIKKSNRIKDGSKTATVIIYIVSIFICAITIYPMYYVIMRSISDPAETLVKNVTFYPIGLYFDTYALIAKDMNMWISYANTIVYVVSGTFLMLVSSVLCAYPLVTNNLIGRKWVVRYLLIPMYFNGGIIPNFIVINFLHLYDNRLALILPTAVGIMNIILCRTYFTSIPSSVSESAEIDGASKFRILFSIFVPLSKPVLAVIAIYTIVNIWNSWFNAMVYITSEEKHPLQMYMQRMLVAQSVDLSQFMSAEEYEKAQKARLNAIQLRYTMIVFTTLPIIFVYPMFQKYFIKGVMLGSLKG
jgi:ABC-type sugar transport system, permease component